MLAPVVGPLRRRPFARRALLATVVALGATLAGACLTLDDISQNVCGNRVLDPGEDCDTLIETKERGYKGLCTAPGSANECHFPVACDPKETAGCAPVCADGDGACVAQCPLGFRAGLDGICRRPSGQFTDPPIPVVFTGVDPHIVDLDGDGENDLLVDGQDREHLAFIQGGIVRGVSEIRKPLNASVSLGELAGAKSTPDIVVPTGTTTHDGFALFRGTVGGRPEAHTFAAYDIGETFRVVPISSRLYGADAPKDTFSAGLLMDCSAGKAGNLCAAANVVGTRVVIADESLLPSQWRRSGVLPVESTFVLGPTHEDLLAFPFHNADNGCMDTLVAVKGASIGDIRLIHPCGPGGLGAELETVTIAASGLPAGCQVESLMVSSSSSGGFDDVHASLACGAGPMKQRVFAELHYPTPGTATLRPGCPSAGSCTISQEKLSCPAPFDARRILAVGDFNADGELDYAANDGIYFGSDMTDPGFATGDEPDQRADFACWRAAVAADLNADGVADVAAAPLGEPGINVMLGAKQSFLATTTLGTSVEAIDAALGDFDGDGTKDIAVALDAQSGELCEDQRSNDVAIFFGRPQSFPEEGRIVGAVPSVMQLGATVLYRDATGVADDGLADLAAISQREIAGCALKRGSLFTGSSTRSIVTPYNVLVRARGILKPPIDIRAIGVVNTAFAPEPQLAVLLNDANGTYFDLIPTQDGESLIEPSACDPTELDPSKCLELKRLPNVAPLRAAAIAAIDTRTAFAGAAVGGTAVQVVVHTGPTIGDLLVLAPFEVGFPVERIELTTGDFDGDAQTDLAVLAFNNPTPGKNQASVVHIFHASQLTASGAGCTYANTNAPVVGIRTIDLGGKTSVVVATTRSLEIVPAIDGACAAPAGTPVPTNGDQLPLEGGDLQAVAVGDLDADGIEDIALASHDRTLVLRQGSTTEYAVTKAAEPPPEE